MGLKPKRERGPDELPRKGGPEVLSRAKRHPCPKCGQRAITPEEEPGWQGLTPGLAGEVSCWNPNGSIKLFVQDHPHRVGLARKPPPTPEKKEKSRRGKRSQRKGRTWEQQVARKLKEAMPGATIRRTPQNETQHGSPDVTTPLHHIEAKCGKRPNVRAALRQAIGDAPSTKWPVVVVHDDAEKPGAQAFEFVALTLEDWLDITAEHWGRR